jgi:hypothetical protein
MPTILDGMHVIVDDRGDDEEYDRKSVVLYKNFWQAWEVYCGLLVMEGHDLDVENPWDIYYADEDREIVAVQDERNP